MTRLSGIRNETMTIFARMADHLNVALDAMEADGIDAGHAASSGEST